MAIRFDATGDTGLWEVAGKFMRQYREAKESLPSAQYSITLQVEEIVG